MDRRSFIKGILAAPAIVRPSSIMKIVPVRNEIIHPIEISSWVESTAISIGDVISIGSKHFVCTMAGYYPGSAGLKRIG